MKGLQDEVKNAYIKVFPVSLRTRVPVSARPQARDLELAAAESRGHRERAEAVRTGLTEELGEVGGGGGGH